MKTMRLVIAFFAIFFIAISAGYGRDKAQSTTSKIKKFNASSDKSVKKYTPPSYNCQQVPDGAITIDGRIDESYWKNAPIMKFMGLVDGSAPTIPSQARLLWDNNYIYVAYEVFDPNIVAYYGERQRGGHHEGIPVKKILHTGEPEIMFRDSFLKFLIDPDGDGRNYIEIHINAINNISDLTLNMPYEDYPGGQECRKYFNLPLKEKTKADWYWNCQGLKSAVQINGTLNFSDDKDRCWTTELAVPWTALKPFTKGPYSPAFGKNIWRAHLGHVYNAQFDYSKRRLAKHEYATWPVIAILNCHLPNRWGALNFIKMRPKTVKKGWRVAWLGGHKHPDCLLKVAKELNFDAVVVYWEKEKTLKFIKRARAFGLDTYTWIFPEFPQGNKAKYKQQMTEDEDKTLQHERELGKKGKVFFSGHQGGGEPLPGKKDVLIYDIPCFHHHEVLELMKKRVKEILETAPELKGVALDMFGYQNYHCCYCPTSMQAFDKYCQKHPELTRKEAWPKFNFETLIKFQNDLCDYARTVRPDVKITNHVWPVYLPEPLYGNRLNLDYCAQTAAWFFKPFWQDDKIVSYSKTIVNDAQKYHKRQQGIPFLGYYNRSKYPVKSPERLAHEIELILANSPDGSIAIYNFSDIVNHPKALEAVKKVFQKYDRQL